jgi:phosphonatase-like hydrolase
MRNIKLVVLDMAGTTIDEDNVVYKTLHKSIRDAGFDVTLEDVLLHGAGKEKHQAIVDTLNSKKIPTANSLDIYKHFKDNLDAAYNSLDVKTFDGVEHLLATLHQRGIKVVLNTGYNSKIANLLLDKLGWKKGEEYDFLITSDDVENGRPQPDMIHLAMQLTGVKESAATLKAGDSAIDIKEGKNAGCGITVGVTTGAQTKEQLAEAQPTYILTSLVDILKYL